MGTRLFKFKCGAGVPGLRGGCLQGIHGRLRVRATMFTVARRWGHPRVLSVTCPSRTGPGTDPEPVVLREGTRHGGPHGV